MTDEELKTLEQIKATQASGGDPFGDGDDDLLPEQADESEAVSAQELPTEEDGATSPDGGADDGADGGPDVLASVQADDAPIKYQSEAPADYKQQRAQLLAERASAMREMMNGEMSAEDFAAVDARVSDTLEDLSAARIRAETLQEANAQAQQRYQQSLIQRLIARTKLEVDYATTPEAQGQFDTALQVLAAQPANKDKDFGDLIDSAHAMVKAMRGVATPARVATATATAPTRKPAGEAPVTLRSLPSASTPNTGSVVDQLGRLRGAEYEAAFNKLSPAQKASLLDE